MSWVNIRGKMYHCLKCPETITVEYDGGARLTQIGDNRIYEQMELAKRYGQPMENPDNEGWYLHDEIICKACFQRRYMKGGQYDVAMNMEALLNQLLEIKDKLERRLIRHSITCRERQKYFIN